MAATAMAATVVAAVLVPGRGSAMPDDPGQHHASVDSNVYPWSSLVKLFNSVGGSCTGAVIARDRILTAGHCIYAFRTHRFLPPEALHVLVGYDRGDYRTHARVVRYRLGPGYDPEAERRTAASDWVVLDLADKLPDDVRPLKLAPVSGADGDRVILAGFARDRAYVITADNDCHITGLADGGRLIGHDCMIEPGDSGAPLLERQDPGAEARIVAIAIGIWHLDKSHVGIAAPLPADLLVDAASLR